MLHIVYLAGKLQFIPSTNCYQQASILLGIHHDAHLCCPVVDLACLQRANKISVGLCQRRQWSEPHYEVTPSRHGYSCVVRVNNREYQTSKYYPSEVTAKEAAATIAFNICRSFSVNDGMYPNGFAHDNIVQGRAVPVGAGRATRRQAGPIKPDYRLRTESISSGSRSGGSSPDISDDSSTSLYNRHGPPQMSVYPSARHVPGRQHR